MCVNETVRVGKLCVYALVCEYVCACVCLCVRVCVVMQESQCSSRQESNNRIIRGCSAPGAEIQAAPRAFCEAVPWVGAPRWPERAPRPCTAREALSKPQFPHSVGRARGPVSADTDMRRPVQRGTVLFSSPSWWPPGPHSQRFQGCLTSCPIRLRATWTLPPALPGPGAQQQKSKSSRLALLSTTLGTCLPAPADGHSSRSCEQNKKWALRPGVP